MELYNFILLSEKYFSESSYNLYESLNFNIFKKGYEMIFWDKRLAHCQVLWSESSKACFGDILNILISFVGFLKLKIQIYLSKLL